MIFVTVGVQLPFDRLVRGVDDWARASGREDVVAQVGASTYTPHTIRAQAYIGPDLYRDLVNKADLVIAHAGMGSILTALEMGKPIIVMPRRAALGEHRNDHQLSTARRMQAQPTITVVQDETELVAALTAGVVSQQAEFASRASEDLVGALREMISRQRRRPLARLLGRRQTMRS